jgi:hypothetical protein
MATHYIYEKIIAPDAYVNNIGTGNVILQNTGTGIMEGLVCRNGTLTMASGVNMDIVHKDIELGIPSSDDLMITENTIYNDANIINNLTVDGCVLTISEISDLTIIGSVNLLNGGTVIGSYSTTPVINGDLEVLGEINLFN